MLFSLSMTFRIPTQSSHQPLPFAGGLLRSTSILSGGSLILATYGALLHQRMALSALIYGNSFIQPLSEAFLANVRVSMEDSEWQLALDVLEENDDDDDDDDDTLAPREYFRTEEEEKAVLMFIKNCFLPRFIPNGAPPTFLSELLRMLIDLNPETSVIFMAFLFMERLQVCLEDLMITDSEDISSSCLQFRRWFALCILYASKMIDDEEIEYLSEHHIMPWMDADTDTVRAWERKGYSALGYMLHVTTSEWSSWVTHLLWSAGTLPSEDRALFRHLLAKATVHSSELVYPAQPLVPAKREYKELEYDEIQQEHVSSNVEQCADNTSGEPHTRWRRVEEPELDGVQFEDVPLTPTLSPPPVQYYELQRGDASPLFPLEQRLPSYVELDITLPSCPSSPESLPCSTFSVPCLMMRYY